MTFFQTLQQQKDIPCTKEQLGKLKTYKIFLFDCFLWKYRTLYLELFVSFLDYDISGDEFSKQVIIMQSTHINQFHQLMDQSQINFEFFNQFSLSLNAFGFGNIINLVEQACDSFVSDELLLKMGENFRKEGEINETQLRERVKKIISRVME